MIDAFCQSCGAPMTCNPGPDCWCAKLPFQPMPERPEGCLCPACLEASRALVAQEGKRLEADG